jgi:hypothetical protein
MNVAADSKTSNNFTLHDGCSEATGRFARTCPTFEYSGGKDSRADYSFASFVILMKAGW